MMKSKILFKGILPVLTVTLLAGVLFAGTTGKIAGVARDAETGEALAGANIVLEGTYLGAAADGEGRYFIINNPSGDLHDSGRRHRLQDLYGHRSAGYH